MGQATLARRDTDKLRDRFLKEDEALDNKADVLHLHGSLHNAALLPRYDVFWPKMGGEEERISLRIT
jgi:hypothetical protein